MNVIKVGILVGVSVVSDFSLTSSALDLYSGTIEYRKSSKPMSTLTQIGQKWQDGVCAFGTAAMFTAVDDMKNLCSLVIENHKDIDVLDLLMRKMKNSKPIPAEFSQIIDEDFWDLI